MAIPEPLKHCYARTLRIEDDNSKPCSSFVLNYEGHQWLVTARHVVHDIETGTDKPFEVFDPYGVKHSDSDLEMLHMTNLFVDVTVFRLWKEYVDLGSPLEPYGGENPYPAQDVYFLGFPHLGNPLSYGLSYASPTTPLIKQAIVSGEAKHRNGASSRKSGCLMAWPTTASLAAQ